MKRLYFLISICLMANIMVTAQVSRTIDVNAGGVKSAIASNEWSSISNLTVKGTIDARDFWFIRDTLTSLSVLDLSQTSIKSYSYKSGSYVLVMDPVLGKIEKYVETIIKTYNATNIPKGAFGIADTTLFRAEKAMTSLTNIMLPFDTDTIENGAFAGCENLSSITMPSVTFVGYRTFADCSSLGQTISLPSVKTIGSYAFSGCKSINSIDLPNTETIGSNAFFLCTSLSSINMPSVINIADNAFRGCINLTSITIPPSLKKINSYSLAYCGITSLDVPSTVTSIGDQAFYGCLNLKQLTIANTIKSLGYYLIYGCTNLTSIEAPANFLNRIIPPAGYYGGGTFGAVAGNFTSKLTTLKINSDTLINQSAVDFINNSYRSLKTFDLYDTENTELPSELLYNFYSLENLVLPKSLTKVSYRSVSDCVSLKAINIPATVTDIEMRAFENCRSIKTVTFEANSKLKTIGNWAFYSCHALDSINIPAGVISIGDGAFWSCNYLKTIKLPSSVVSIGDTGFENCRAMTGINVSAVIPPLLQTNTFNLVYKNIPVIVPEGSLAAYKTAPVWKDFLNIKTIGANGIEDLIGTPYTVYSKGKNIFVDNAQTSKINVFDISGRMISEIIQASQNEMINIPNEGIYFVRIGNKTTKVLVK